MASAQPIMLQPQPPRPPTYGSQIIVGALAGVLAWWLIETITSARAAAAEGEDEDE